ncbi:MAG TPA: hypothetical protein VJ858_01230 [Acidimicrobiia bacterium]|nr:hypothetical protein [Acidimicrobiia bacterium]
MDLKSHLGRPADFRSPAFLLMVAAVVLAAGAALLLWLGGEPGSLFLAPVFTFLTWALLREVDPDHPWSAILAGVVAAVWVLVGGETLSGWAVAGLMVAARIVTSTTGRRPLGTDLAIVTVFGIAIAFTVEGWLAGFGIALAFYIDDRFRGENRMAAIAAATVTAVGATIVASLNSAFPERFPEVIQYLAVTAGILGLILSMREPATPISQVDARHAAFIEQDRLHVSRTLAGLAVFLMSLLAGAEGRGTVVLIVPLALAVVSNEIELLRRRAR